MWLIGCDVLCLVCEYDSLIFEVLIELEWV